MSDVVNAKKRDLLGSSNAKRIRAAGDVPAVLYGHGEANLALTVPKEDIDAAIRHGSQVVQLQGELDENAFIRDVQWDAFGIDVIHVDFTRISADESVETSVSVELRGTAPGASQGGSVQHQLHDLQLECPAMSIPDKLEVSINSLEVGQSITAGEVELPEGAKLLTDANQIVVTCVEQASADEEEAEGDAPMSAEPEVIGRKADDEEGDEG